MITMARYQALIKIILGSIETNLSTEALVARHDGYGHGKEARALRGHLQTRSSREKTKGGFAILRTRL